LVTVFLLLAVLEVDFLAATVFLVDFEAALGVAAQAQATATRRTARSCIFLKSTL